MYTPLDIENKKFSKKMMNGYDVEEVDDFLDQLTVDYGKMYKESSELKKKIEDLEKNMEHYKAIESTLQNTLVMAQTTAEDVKKQFDVYKAKMESLLISQLELLKEINAD